MTRYQFIGTKSNRINRDHTPKRLKYRHRSKNKL